MTKKESLLLIGNRKVRFRHICVANQNYFKTRGKYFMRPEPLKVRLKHFFFEISFCNNKYFKPSLFKVVIVVV